MKFTYYYMVYIPKVKTLKMLIHTKIQQSDTSYLKGENIYKTNSDT